MEGSKYLELAETIISARGVPLSGAQIIDFAREYGVLPYDNYGTIVKTLQARIAEDIAKHRNSSRFIRTGIGTYFLSRLVGKPTAFGEVKWTPTRASREKPEHPHRILTVPQSAIPPGYFVQGWGDTNRILDQGRYDYQSEIQTGYLPVVTGVILKWRRKVFSYQVGVHTHFDRTVGSNTILLRKFLDEFDLDFFEIDGTGATSSTARTALPVLSAGRRSRLQSGQLREEEKLQFFHVSELLANKTAMHSKSFECFQLVSSIDLSSKYSMQPKSQRRLELNRAGWNEVCCIKNTLDDEDSLTLLSSVFENEKSR